MCDVIYCKVSLKYVIAVKIMILTMVVPLACGATMVSLLHADGSPWPRAAEQDGVARGAQRNGSVFGIRSW